MKRVLVVDDNEANLYLLRQVLQSNGYAVDEARHGLEALAHAQTSRPALLITDLLMPEMDGYTLLRQWKTDPALKHIPSIVYTATYTDSDDQRLALQLGADAFIVKPMEADAFVAVVNQVIEKAKNGSLPATAPGNEPLEETQVAYNATLVRKLEKRSLEMRTLTRNLHASKARFKALAENSMDMILEADPILHRILWVNRAACEGFGLSLEAFVNADSKRFYDQSDPRLATLIAERDATGRTRGEVTAIRANGAHFPVEISSVVYSTPEHQQIANITLRDLSAQKQAQATLLQSQADAATLQAAMDAHALLSMTDAEGVITYVNDGLCATSGYRRDELIGKTHLVLRSDQHDATEYRALWRTVQAGQMWKGEWCNRTREGALFWVETTVVPFATTQGPPDKYVTIQTDITERKLAERQRGELEAQLRETQKLQAVGTLASGIAHDFNNIVAAILGFSTLMREEIAPDGPAAEYLGQIQKAGRRAREVVQRIVSFSRPQSTALADIAVQDAVHETLAIAQATLPTTIAFKTHLPNQPVLVRADNTQLQQVLLNIYTNAWHAAPAKSARIDTRLEICNFASTDTAKPPNLAPGPFAHLWISDNGCGMSEAVRQRIFDPFFTTKPVGQGTGLGLSAVRSIVVAHHGAITVESQPDVGTTFHLYFPLVDQSDFHQPVARKPEITPPLTGSPHVLLVDDDSPITLLLEAILARAGFRVTPFTDPALALAALQKCPKDFDLLLTDFNMPGMSGLELARQVQSIRADLPIAIVSGHISSELIQQAHTLRIEALLHKERVSEDLVLRLSQLLQTSET
ncbi:hypothetical protein LPB72_19845 [Hydrogenophaga crassostreae]|uniref:histidine kinase n=1 Tax=Hydrogenophaga crassostreae TaxID=1763535 RepID=A0A167GST2_9BURK|nr:response regulator [Hydrogenophaga crassostreae]AOW11741.1 hypothetical protein LPB072_01580 [Hydrogenophaga crassostreae]OAD39833.1 hypothetical protein LPB72_19845 [Hydrogenophaga crassostreae]